MSTGKSTLNWNAFDKEGTIWRIMKGSVLIIKYRLFLKCDTHQNSWVFKGCISVVCLFDSYVVNFTTRISLGQCFPGGSELKLGDQAVILEELKPKSNYMMHLSEGSTISTVDEEGKVWTFCDNKINRTPIKLLQRRFQVWSAWTVCESGKFWIERHSHILFLIWNGRT